MLGSGARRAVCAAAPEGASIRPLRVRGGQADVPRRRGRDRCRPDDRGHSGRGQGEHPFEGPRVHPSPVACRGSRRLRADDRGRRDCRRLLVVDGVAERSQASVGERPVRAVLLPEHLQPSPRAGRGSALYARADLPAGGVLWLVELAAVALVLRVELWTIATSRSTTSRPSAKPRSQNETLLMITPPSGVSVEEEP